MAEAVNPYAGPAAQIAAGYRHCESCRAQILEKAEICPQCGVRQRRPVSKTALLLFTFFTGGLGGHKFYLGRYWQGALYLLFFWTYIPGLVALIEFIVYAVTSSERLNEKYSAASGGTVVAIVVVAVAGVMVIGILAAIAIPAYHDFEQRARTSGLLMSAMPWREAIGEYYAETRKLPASVAELGRNAPPGDGAPGQDGTVSLSADGVLTLTMSAEGSLKDKTIVIRPEPAGDVLQWDCKGGTLEPRYRPSTCRP